MSKVESQKSKVESPMQTKDWNGNKESAHIMIGNNYRTKTESADREQRDYYATEPRAVRLLMEQLNLPKDFTIWECACGEGHLSEELHRLGYDVYSSDIINRGYRNQNAEIDFLNFDGFFDITEDGVGDDDIQAIITNPPYKYTTEFILKALKLVSVGGIVAMLLNLNYLSGKGRYAQIFSKYPPSKVYVFTGRVSCAKNGDFEHNSGSAINYAWFVWRKGFIKVTPQIEWIEI